METIETMYDVMIPMRDGIRLLADVYLPKGGGRFPVVLMRTPYGWGKENETGLYYAQNGYACVLQNCRGTFGSEGALYAWQNEAQDGYDTLEWIGGQPWCDGNVGMEGGSYIGLVQWLVAPLRSRYLKTIVPMVCPADFWHDLNYMGGAFRLHLSVSWAMRMWFRSRHDAREIESEPVGEYMLPGIFRILPLMDADKVANLQWDFYRDWIRHPSRDEYWDRLSNLGKFDRMDVPALILGGWYDAYARASFVNFNGMRQEGETEEARTGTKVVMGAWNHGDACTGTNTKAGEVEFGPELRKDLRGLVLRWFDYWLKQEDNGIEREPPVSVFVMGRNQWRYDDQWPPEGTRFVEYYLHSDGSAHSLPGDGTLSTELSGDEPPDEYVYDPADPVPTQGGFTVFPRLFADGAVDQRSVEVRQDVLVYSTPELEEEVEVTGPIMLKLFAASSARDTDFTGKLVDVYPDGRAINLCEGILRARYHKSETDPELIEPGQVYEFTLDLLVTSNVFLKGHRIRLEVSSSNFPQFDRNPNTGHAFGMDAELQIAEQTVYHSKQYPSYLLLPINDGS